MSNLLNKPAHQNTVEMAVSRVLNSYKEYVSKFKTSENTKSFAAYHKDCKIALSHLDDLLKLANQIDWDENVSPKPTSMIEQAKENILPHAEEYIQ